MNRSFLSAALLSAATIAHFHTAAQPGSYRDRQAAEYKNLSNATQRAFSVPTSNYSPPAYQSSSSPYSQSSSTPSYSRPSSGSVSGTSSYYNAFADGSVARRQAAYEAKMEAREKEWSDKVAKVRSFLKSSGIVPNTPETHNQFFLSANAAGLDAAAITSVIMSDAAAYNRAVARENGMNPNYSGSTRKECSGSCSETVTYLNGSGVYTGNTKEGAPHGAGTITLPNGQTITGHFFEGAVSGGKVFVKWPKEEGKETAGVYEGGYANDAMNGYGVYKDGPNYIDEGEYKDGKLHGKCTLTRKSYVHTGTWTENKMTGKHVWAYKNGRIVEQDMDDPAAKPVTIAEGTNAPTAGLRTYTTEDGTVYEGEPVIPGKPFKGKYTFADGTTTVGLHDKDGYLIKGKVTYGNSGHWFEGEFKNRQRYRGTCVYKYGTFTGEFEPSGVNFKAGRDVASNDGTISDGFYGPLNTKLGYRRTQRPNGVVQEEIYTDDKISTAIVYHRTTGDVFTGIVRGKEGYQMFGVNKRPDGKLQPAGLTNEARWSAVAPEEEAEAKLAAILGQKAIDAGRASYNAAVKWNPELMRK